MLSPEISVDSDTNKINGTVDESIDDSSPNNPGDCSTSSLLHVGSASPTFNRTSRIPSSSSIARSNSVLDRSSPARSPIIMRFSDTRARVASVTSQPSSSGSARTIARVKSTRSFQSPTQAIQSPVVFTPHRNTVSSTSNYLSLPKPRYPHRSSLAACNTYHSMADIRPGVKDATHLSKSATTDYSLTWNEEVSSTTPATPSRSMLNLATATSSNYSESPTSTTTDDPVNSRVKSSSVSQGPPTRLSFASPPPPLKPSRQSPANMALVPTKTPDSVRKSHKVHRLARFYVSSSIVFYMYICFMAIYRAEQEFIHTHGGTE